MRDSSCQRPIGVTFHEHSVRSKPKKNRRGASVRKKPRDDDSLWELVPPPSVIVGRFSYDTNRWLEEGIIYLLTFSQELERW